MQVVVPASLHSVAPQVSSSSTWDGVAPEPGTQVWSAQGEDPLSWQVPEPSQVSA